MQVEDDLQEEQIEETADDQAQEIDGEQQQQVAPEIEARAREMGWVPKDRYRGDPANWRPADEFVRRGEEILPFVQKRARDLEEKLAEQEKAFQTKLAALERMSKRGIEMAREQTRLKYEEIEDKAAELGDTKALREARAKKAEAMKAFDEEEDAREADKPKGAAKEDTASADPVAMQWAKDNPWYSRSAMLHGAADEIFDEVTAEMPGASMQERLDEVTARVNEMFPERFGGRRNGAQRTQAVEGAGSRDGGTVNGGSAWSKLPAEFKKQGDELIQTDRLFLERGEDPKNPKHLAAARERYAKEALEAMEAAR